MKHRFLDHCWICKQTFNDSVVPHNHHIVPRAFGGTDGPQVSICTGHHDRLHSIANKIVANLPFPTLFDTSGPRSSDINKRLLELANIAARAELKYKNDPNKKTTVPLSLSGDNHKRLKELCRLSGETQVRLLSRLIRNEHIRVFQRKR